VNAAEFDLHALIKHLQDLQFQKRKTPASMQIRLETGVISPGPARRRLKANPITYHYL
jgi:hypothetical protein